MALPPVIVTSPPANPYPYGLYSAATVIGATDARHQGGMALDSPNTPSHGQWPVICPVPEDTPDKQAQRDALPTFPAITVWAADECKAVGISAEQAQERAIQALKLAEPLEVEAFAATQLKKVTPAETAASLEEAVSLLEEALVSHGHTGVIHARRGLMPLLSKVIIRQGGQLLSPGGHKWAFGGGYQELGDTLVGTGPVLIRQSPAETSEAFNSNNNVRTALAERVVSVGWEGPTLAVSVSATP